MSAIHLKAGSQDVPNQDGKLRLYNMRYCPYGQRILLLLDAKNIDYDVVNIDLKSKPEWFLEQFPQGKVPAIKVDGEKVSESLIIADYLDERYQQYPLYPKDPLKKAKDKMIIVAFDKVITAFFKIFYSVKLENSILPMLDELDYFESHLAINGTQFFSGDKPGMIDYMIWPWCERLDMFAILGGEKFKIPEDRFHKMHNWSKAMLEDEAVKKSYLTPEQHTKFFQTFHSSTTNYDIL